MIAGALLLAGCKKDAIGTDYSVSDDKKLVVYTAHKEEIYGPIIREFEERTGIWVEIVDGGTNELLETIAFENGGTVGDVMFGGGVDSLGAYEDYFEPYVTVYSGKLDAEYASKNNAYTVFSKLPVVFVYNTKLVLESGAPKTWAELLNGQWDGQIAFADPQQSGSSYTALAIMIQQLKKTGKSEESIIAAFSNSLGGRLSSGSSKVVDDVASGDKMIGLTLEETVLKKQAKGADIDMVYPSDGTCAVPDGAAILKDCRHKENAEKFLEFIVGDDVQHLLEDALFRRSVRKDFSSPEIPNEIIYNSYFSNGHRDEFIDIFTECMKNGK